MKKIFIALDGNYTLDEFCDIAKQLLQAKIRTNIKICFKIGMEFFYSFGFYGVNKIEELGAEIFLDLKFFDISNTVEGALRAIYKNSKGFIKYTTLHLLNGTECLRRAHSFNNQQQNKIKILGVSLLTSLDESYLREQNFSYQSSADAVKNMIKLSHNFVDGCICSPLEAAFVRQIAAENFEIITPGVQINTLNNDQSTDQKRTATPLAAFQNGASGIVIGRAIMQTPNKLLTLEQILSDLSALS